MTVLARVFFGGMGCVGLYMAYASIVGGLSMGHTMMRTAVIPAALIFLTISFSTESRKQKLLPIVTFLAGLFFTLIGFGMYGVTDQLAYSLFGVAGIALMVLSLRRIEQLFAESRESLAN